MASLDRNGANNLPAQFVVDTTALSQLAPGSARTPSLPLRSRFSVLSRHWWKIALFVLAAASVTWIVSGRLKPMYESTAVIDADRQVSSGVIGDAAARSFSDSETDEFLSTQLKLIESDAVLREVVRKYDLLFVEGQLASPAELGEAPIELKNLKVRRPPRTHLLYISYRSGDPKLSADAANAIAQSYIKHSYETRVRAAGELSRFMETQLDELKEKMNVSKTRLAAVARELDMIDPERRSSVLSSRLLELNTEYTKAQSERVGKETSYRSLKNGGLAAVQISSQAGSLNALKARVDGLRSNFVSVRSTYGPNHPIYKRAEADLLEVERQYDDSAREATQRIDIDYQQAVEREAAIRDKVTETKADLDKLSSRALDYQQLKHEADADTKLYEELVRRIREAGLNSGFQGNAIRLADIARPALLPVYPRPKLNLAVAFLCSLLLAICTAFTSDLLNARVHGPDQVCGELNTRLVATLPNVRRLPATHRLQGEAESAAPLGRLMRNANNFTSYEESIRQLRNFILLSETYAPVRSVMVTSGMPGEGKSTTAMHLAIARAQQGERTLLIDADMRNPTLHTRLGLPEGSGLAEVLAGDAAPDECLIDVVDIPHLRVLRAGHPTRRASDLVGPSVVDVVREAAKSFDFVVVDAPPVLTFAETLQIATAVDSVIVIVKAGSTSTQVVASVLSRLSSVHARVIGVVVNRFRGNPGSQYYASGRYGRAAVLPVE